MAKHIQKCTICGSYTMNEECKCKGKAITTRPPKYTPNDKYAKYRRTVKRPKLKKEGLI